MGSKGTNTSSSFCTQHSSRFAQGSTRLDQIIDEDDIFSFGVSFLQSDCSLLSFPTHLDADDFFYTFLIILTETLRRTVIRKGDGCIFWNIQKRCRRMELGVHSK